nr:MAG TPA: hypothetical protein [Caudoviricetes sp.]
MGIKYGNLNVDEKYSGILEPNLYFDSILVPGVTYIDKYQTGPAGGIYVHKLDTTAVTVGTPGRDFTDEASSDTLIPILLNNNYMKSKKIYRVQAAAVAFDIANEQLATATQEIKESRQQSALGCLVQEGTKSNGADITANAVDAVLDEAAKIKKGKANVVLCSPEFYALVLKENGKDFTPAKNDEVAATGAIGDLYGFTWIRAAGLSEAEAKYYDSTGTLKTVALHKAATAAADGSAVDFILYNSETLSIIDNLESFRLVDSESFTGSKAQVELNTGMKVTTPELARVRTHTIAKG